MTLPKKMRPFKSNGVVFLIGPGIPGKGSTDCFFKIELFLLIFLRFCGVEVASLQHKMIFSNKKT